MPAIEAIKNRRVDLSSMISERFPLEQGAEAFQAASGKGILKVVLDVN